MEGGLATHLIVNINKDPKNKLVINGGSWEVQDEAAINGGGDNKPLLDTTSSSSITPMMVIATFVAVLGSFTVGCVVGYTSPVQSQIMEELNLSTAEFSLFGSVSLIGAALGSIMCGKLTDYLGRRLVMGLSGLFCIFGWFSIAIAQGALLLDVGRLMLGFAISIVNYAVPVYIAEFAPKNLRGGFVVLHLFMLTAGSSTVFLIGLVASWRTLALLGMIPNLVLIVGLFFIPDSPRWLMMIGEDERFEAALQSFRGVNADISEEAAEIKECTEAFQQLSKVGLLQLFQRKYAYVLTVGIGLLALVSLVGLNGILFYARSIFESAGFSGTVGTIALALCQCPSVLLAVFLLDRCGRRPLLMISAALLCLGCLLAGFSFVLQDLHLLEGISPYFVLVGIVMYTAAYPIGVGGVTAVVTSEIYPINIKGIAGSLGSLVSCLLGWVVSYAFNFFMDWSASGTFFILAGFCVVTLIFAAKVVPETKGITLEELHMSTSRVWQ